MPRRRRPPSSLAARLRDCWGWRRPPKTAKHFGTRLTSLTRPERLKLVARNPANRLESRAVPATRASLPPAPLHLYIFFGTCDGTLHFFATSVSVISCSSYQRPHARAIDLYAGGFDSTPPHSRVTKAQTLSCPHLPSLTAHCTIEAPKDLHWLRAR